jgi:hypothetical protein
MSDTNSHSAGKWSLWPVSIVAFFTVAVLGCASFVAFCNLHPSELVAEDYYEQEMRYQGQMERVERARGLGQDADIALDSERGTIRVTLPRDHATGQLEGSVNLYRPSSAKLDLQLPLNLSDTGTQLIPTANLQPGRWVVKVTWKAQGQDYFMEKKLTIDHSTQTAASLR